MEYWLSGHMQQSLTSALAEVIPIILSHSFKQESLQYKSQWIATTIIDKFSCEITNALLLDKSDRAQSILSHLSVLPKNHVSYDYNWLGDIKSQPDYDSDLSSIFDTHGKAQTKFKDTYYNTDLILPSASAAEQTIAVTTPSNTSNNQLELMLPHLQKLKHLGKLCFIDLETTGLSVANDRIIEIGIIKFDLESNTVETFNKLINPGFGATMHEKAEAVHGHSLAELQQYPILIRYWPEITKMIKNSWLVGYNIQNFDIPMLINERNRNHLKEFFSYTGAIDLAQYYWKHVERNTLSACYYFMLGERFNNAHTSIGDSVACCKLLSHICDTNGLPDTESAFNAWCASSANQCNYNKKIVAYSSLKYDH